MVPGLQGVTKGPPPNRLRGFTRLHDCRLITEPRLVAFRANTRAVLLCLAAAKVARNIFSLGLSLRCQERVGVTGEGKAGHGSTSEPRTEVRLAGQS